MIPGALFFVAGPALAAGAVYLVRGWRAGAVILAMSAIALLTLILWAMPVEPTARVAGIGVDPSGPITVLGRSLRLEVDDRPALFFMYVASFFLFGGTLVAPAPRVFLPAALAVLSLLAAALFVQPFLFAAAFLEVVAFLAAVMLSDPDSERPVQRGALRFLIFVTFSLPFILLTGWVLELYAGSPDDLSLLSQATWFLTAGFVILLGVAPFHSWIPPLAQEASPFPAAFMFTVVQAAIVFFMLQFLNLYTWLGTNPQVYAYMRLAGLAMVSLGGAFAFAQDSLGRLMGYAVVADYGASLLAIGLGTPEGLRVGLTLIALRGIALSVGGLGIGTLRPLAGGDDFSRLRGWGRRQPLAVTAVAFGLLSLVGFPLTAGFPGRWALWNLLAPTYPVAAAVVLLSAAGVVLAYARGLAALVKRAGAGIREGGLEIGEGERRKPEGLILGVPRLAFLYYAVGLSVILLLGIFPQWLLPTLARAAEAFANLAG